MSSKKPSAGKTISWAYSAVAAFTALSIAVPVLWERWARREKKREPDQ